MDRVDFADAMDIETPHPMGDKDGGRNACWIHYVGIDDSINHCILEQIKGEIR